MKASIIIVTRNRAADLAKTLANICGIAVPDGLAAELLVVDNGSNDETAEVVKSFRMDKIHLRYIREEMPGLSRGRNRGLAETTGEILVFTDDDVRVPRHWLVSMTEPICSGAAKAVAGGVVIAPHLLRPWMSPIHRSWLASSEWMDPQKPETLIGANMAFSREVLTKVPGFDVELGAGALGYNDETLFALQLKEAGYHIFNRLDVCVEHHFQPARLKRNSWLDAAENRGASLAYQQHHWEHWGFRIGRLRLMRASWNLSRWRKTNHTRMEAEGCSDQEMNLLFQKALARARLKERGCSRNYERHGLKKTRESLGRLRNTCQDTKTILERPAGEVRGSGVEEAVGRICP